jgi:branched-chain amino acid transport system substrate-binding protein
MRTFAALSLTALAVLAAPAAAAAADPFVVGVISPMTGPIATIGSRQVAAIQWWADGVNAAGGIKGRKVELALCDDRGSPEVAVTCARNHMDRGVALLLDTSIAGAVRGVMPLLTHGPVMIIPSPIINPPASSYVFQTSPTDLDMTRGLARYIKENHKDRVAMIASTDATGEVAVADAKIEFPAAGLQWSLTRIDMQSNDASIQLANALKDNPPVLYSAYAGGGAAAVVKSYVNLGLTVPLVVSNANLTEAFLALIRNDMPPRLMGMGIKSMVPAAVTDPEERARVEHFKTSYESSRKEAVDVLSQFGLMVADTAEAVLRNVDDPRNADATKHFLETTPVKSLLTMHFSPTSHVGLTSDAAVVLEYKKDHWEKAGPLN